MKSIVGTLGYVVSPDRSSVLMMHRNSRADDVHLGKYNGLGGKVHRDEDVATGMVREIREEAGIEATALQLRGTINWTGFGPSGEDWIAFIFLITAFEGEPQQSCPEGEIVWVERDRLFDLPMWEGDHCFLPMVFDDDPRPFHGYMPYDNDQHTSWSYYR